MPTIFYFLKNRLLQRRRRVALGSLPHPNRIPYVDGCMKYGSNDGWMRNGSPGDAFYLVDGDASTDHVVICPGTSWGGLFSTVGDFDTFDECVTGNKAVAPTDFYFDGGPLRRVSWTLSGSGGVWFSYPPVQVSKPRLGTARRTSSSRASAPSGRAVRRAARDEGLVDGRTTRLCARPGPRGEARRRARGRPAVPARGDEGIDDRRIVRAPPMRRPRAVSRVRGRGRVGHDGLELVAAIEDPSRSKVGVELLRVGSVEPLQAVVPLPPGLGAPGLGFFYLPPPRGKAGDQRAARRSPLRMLKARLDRGHEPGVGGALDDGRLCSANVMAMPPPSDGTDVGHQGDVDVTQIEKMLRLTPTERLRKHESWRLFARKALKDAELRREGPRGPDAGWR
jgi:hypothetical protein